MTTIKIIIDDCLLTKLRALARAHGRSESEEARALLEVALSDAHAPGLGTQIRQRFEEIGGVDLEIPERQVLRPRIDFSDENNT